MSIEHHENRLYREAERLHQYAQNTGDPIAYTRAASLYDKVGDFRKAAECREAADRLRAG